MLEVIAYDVEYGPGAFGDHVNGSHIKHAVKALQHSPNKIAPAIFLFDTESNYLNFPKGKLYVKLAVAIIPTSHNHRAQVMAVLDQFEREYGHEVNREFLVLDPELPPDYSEEG